MAKLIFFLLFSKEMNIDIWQDSRNILRFFLDILSICIGMMATGIGV
jgi:hypothetical protein